MPWPRLIRLLPSWAVLVSALVLGGYRVGVRAQEPQQHPVSITFTAFDENRSPVTTLRKEDVRVLEDGVPQEVTTFGRQTEQPLSLAILIDTSISQVKVLPAEKKAAISFVDAIIRPGQDTAAIISFTKDAILKQNYTNDPSQLRQAINDIKLEPSSGYDSLRRVPIGRVRDPSLIPSSPTPQGSTAIWDAIWATCQIVLDKAPTKTRRVIILLSDGTDTGSIKRIDEASDRALQSETVIFAIGLGDTSFDGLNRGSLKRVSERTGGYAFFPKKDDDLPAVLKAIEQSLRSPYLISYSPKNRRADKRFHKIQIEIVNPELRRQNLRISHQRGYFTR